jgi:hypothetical protein
MKRDQIIRRSVESGHPRLPAGVIAIGTALVRLVLPCARVIVQTVSHTHVYRIP